jgi:hypothetical protein
MSERPKQTFFAEIAREELQKKGQFGSMPPTRQSPRPRSAFTRIGQAAASISYPVDFAMNSSRVWQTIADGARPRADALISAFRA